MDTEIGSKPLKNFASMRYACLKMSTEEQHTAIGRLVSDRQDANLKSVALRAEIRRAADAYREAGEALGQFLSGVVTIESDGAKITPGDPVENAISSLPQSERVMFLYRECQAETERFERLQKELRKLGL